MVSIGYNDKETYFYFPLLLVKICQQRMKTRQNHICSEHCFHRYQTAKLKEEELAQTGGYFHKLKWHQVILPCIKGIENTINELVKETETAGIK